MDLYIQQIVIGCILGDGSITKSGCLQIEQSSKQKEYVYWKYEQLKSIVSDEPKRVNRYDKRTQCTYSSDRFYTRALFKQLRKEFYPIEKKSIPLNVQNFLKAPVTLAVWYMDDGGRGANTKKGVILSVPNYDFESQLRLQTALKFNYGIDTTLHKNGQLYVPMSSYTTFDNCISPHIIPSMRYKLSITP
uniref:Homing endonuclease LAGLIDADG domain-containing protein n=1 Tax=Rhipiliopsis peltata TaxID=2320810 RepID=A0A386B1D9_9CHLO|nr:hypothetical protein [Rhipiliopsis peltata]AYC65483.1 hypothetical protein [Rhipiliopsis peltata]